MYKILLTFSFLTVLVSFSCHKKKPLDIDKSVGFPNSIGTYWRYAINDSENARLDTMMIKIVGTTVLENNQPVTIWQKASLFDGIDSDYVSITKEGVTVYPDKLSNSFSKKYLFPLRTGLSWPNQNRRDSSKVLTEATKTVVAGTFQNSYEIIRDYYSLPGYNHFSEEEWFVPEIGMIYRNLQEQSITPTNQKWELLNYHIAQ